MISREEVLAILASAWNDEYSGNCHRLLLENINSLSRNDPYSNQIAIIQSSGTGKSRMVNEQAKFVFTIPFNLRHKEEDEGCAYPKPDYAVYNYLLETRGFESLSPSGLGLRYYRFFEALFTLISAELDALEDQLSIFSKVEELAQFWSDYFATIRDEFYGKVIERANEAPKSESNRDWMSSIKSATAALRRLIGQLRRWDKSDKLKIVMYFDESHTLTEKKLIYYDPNTLYDHFCRCLNGFVDQPLFVIFLSTDFELVNFAIANSARTYQGRAVIHPPITETPFDCMPTLRISPGKLTMEMISKISFMADFGRPLFWTYLRGACGRQNRLEWLEKQMVELAMAKLILHNDFDYDGLSEMARLAVLDVQLSIDYDLRREKAVMVGSQLVASHMRIAYSIPEGCEYVQSGYPSEPLLAEGAARLLSGWRLENKDIVVDRLVNALDTGLLDREELGELTGRQLLLDAYHRAVEKEQGRAKPNFSAGCRFTTFIETLFSDPYAQVVLDSRPDNVEGDKFRGTFQDAFVCFTHFGHMSDDTGSTSAAAWVAFVRHMAIICRYRPRHVDFIIPVLLKNTKLCEQVISGILVRVQRRRDTSQESNIEQNLAGFFPRCDEQDDTPCRAYVTLTMELQNSPFLSEVQTPTQQLQRPRMKGKHAKKQKPGSPPSETGERTRHHCLVKSEHPRYSIFASGCSNKVYRGISEVQQRQYERLLSQEGFLGDHPRQETGNIEALQMMKPFWNGGSSYYHWVQDENLHGVAKVTLEDRVFVGNLRGPETTD